MTNSYIKEYWQGIQDGKWVVGWKIKAIIRHLIESMEDERFIFNPEYAHRRMEWQEKNSLQSYGEFYNKPIQLMLWQKAFWEAYYGFYMRDTGERRFTEATIEVARKNGKSTMLAADNHYDITVGKGGRFICCASNDDRQAALIWEETAKMCKRRDPKGKRCKVNRVKLANPKKNIEVFRLSSKTQNKDGFNFYKVVYDEVHDAPDDEIYDALKRSQSQYLDKSFISCSTQGVVVDGFYDRLLQRANAVVENPEDNIHFLPFLFEQDSENEVWQGDRINRLWEKANPSLPYGVKKYEYLEEQIATAKVDKQARIKMLVKDFNIKQSNAEAWLMLEDIENEEVFNLEDFRHCFYVGGADFSETNDLTAITLLFMKPDSNKKYIYTKYFLPVEKIQNSTDSGARYKDWLKDKLIIPTDDYDNDPKDVAEWLYKLYKEYDIKPFRVGYDKWQAKQFTKRMEELFYDDTCVSIPQSKNILNAPIRLVEDELRAKNINYNNNPILKWNLVNAVLEVDSRDKAQIVKPKNQPYKKIDGAVTLCMAFHMLKQHRDDFMKLVRKTA